MLSLTVDPEIEKRLEALGATTDQTKTALLRQAVLEALDEMEDLRMAEERLARSEREWTQEEVEQALGLDDPVA